LNPDFELDSKFDFLYSEFIGKSGLSRQFNANPVLMEISLFEGRWAHAGNP
jgi:hypothetical protein